MDLLKEHNKKYQFFVDITGIAMNERDADGTIERIKLF